MNALNSILSYITRGKSIENLEDLGIQMFTDDTETQFRNAMEIFQDIHSKWDSLSMDIQDGFVASADEAGLFNEEMANALGIQEEWNDVQKRDASQSAAGVHRRNYFIGMIERMSNVQGVLNGMMDAGGYSLKENAKTMETLEKKQQSLKASVEALAVAIGDAGLGGSLKALVDGGTGALGVINKMPKEMKDMVLATTNAFIAVKVLQLGMKTFGMETPFALQAVTNGIDGLKVGVMSLWGAIKSGGAGLMAAISANLPLLAITAAIGATVAVTNAIKRQKEEREKLIETTKQEIKEHQENYDSAKKLYTAYKTAKEGTDELTDAKKELLDLFPDLLIGYDSEGQAIIGNNEKIEEQIRLLKEQAEAKKDLLRATAEHDIAEGQSKINKLLEDEEKLRQEINKHVHYRDNPDELGTIEGGTGTSLRAEIIAMKNAQIADAQIKLSTASGKLNAELSNLRGSYIALLPPMDDMTAAQKKVADEFIEAAIKEQEYMEQGNFNRELYVKGFEKAITNTYLLARAQAELNSVDAIGDTTAAVFNLQDAYESMGSTTKQVFNELKTLDKVIDDVKKGQKLSADTILDLNEKYGLSLDAIELTTEGYTIEISTLEDLRETKIKTALDGMEAERKLAVTVMKQVRSRLTNYGLEIKQLKDLTEARAIMAGQARIEAGNKAREIADAATGGHSDSGIRNSIYSKAYKQAYDQHMAGVDADLAAYEKALSDIEAVDARTKTLKGLLESGSSTSSLGSGSSGSRASSYENKALNESLKLLEHRKRISEESQSSIKAELEELKRINSLYVKTADERMDMAERLYSTEKRLRDRTLQDSVSFISEKKNFNEMSAEDEIKAWERVRDNQVNNINAVKQANLELYKLKNQLAQDSYNKEENTIKHLTKLGVLSAQQQIAKYRELYEVKVSSLAEEQARVENLFSLYNNLIKEQQQKTKDAYDKRIEQIDEEAKKKKAMHEDEIKAIEKELDLLNRDEQEYDHDKKMDDLKEQLAYWQVRTSEDARKKVIDLLKQIDEAEHKRKVELQRQSLEDRKKTLQDEVTAVDDTAKEERDKLDKSYKRIETAFDSHSTNIVALASTMSKEAYNEWLNNYIIPLQNALADNNFSMADSLFDGLDDFIGGMEGSFGDYGGGGIKDWGGANSNSSNQTSNPNNAQIYNLANSIANLKREYALGINPDAPLFTKPLYEQLSKLNPTISEYLRNNDYITAADYVKDLPKMHKGGKSLSYGAVEMMPGELTFPPDLSVGLERLFPLLSNLAKTNLSTGDSSVLNDKRVIQNFNSPLFHSEKTVFEDDVDERSFSRELQRQISNMV